MVTVYDWLERKSVIHETCGASHEVGDSHSTHYLRLNRCGSWNFRNLFMANSLSERQLGWLSWWLKSNYWDQLEESFETKGDALVDRRLVRAEEWIEENIDGSTAYEIIGTAKEGGGETAWRWLVRLGLPIKKESLNTI